MTIDFTKQLSRWGLVDTPDCSACANRGVIETQAASVTIDAPCPECPRSDWLWDDAAAGWAEQ